MTAALAPLILFLTLAALALSTLSVSPGEMLTITDAVLAGR